MRKVILNVPVESTGSLVRIGLKWMGAMTEYTFVPNNTRYNTLFGCRQGYERLGIKYDFNSVFKWKNRTENSSLSICIENTISAYYTRDSKFNIEKDLTIIQDLKYLLLK